METASKVMYSIANIFNWILAILYLFLIVMNGLALGGVKINGLDTTKLNVGTLVVFIIGFLVCLAIIGLVRIAKDRKSSKGWDVLFMILGIVGGNIFYFLGGLFGIIAVR